MIPLRTELYMWGYEPIQIGSTRKLHTCKNIVYSFWKWTHFPSVTQNEPLKSTLYLWTSYKSISCFSPVWAILQINSSYSQSWVYSTVLPPLHTNVHQRDHFCAFVFMQHQWGLTMRIIVNWNPRHQPYLWIFNSVEAGRIRPHSSTTVFRQYSPSIIQRPSMYIYFCISQLWHSNLVTS